MVTAHPTRKGTLWSVLLDVLGTPPAEWTTVPDVSGSWQWLYADQNGVAVAGPPVCFSSAESAEAWLDANVRPLRSLRVAAVSLLDGEHVVYGPVRLSPDNSVGSVG